MDIKGAGLDILDSFGYTPEKLLNESDLKLNQLLSKMIMEERIKNPKITTGFFVIHENKKEREGKPILQFWVVVSDEGTFTKLKDLDLGELILEAIPENERAGIKQAERVFRFKMKDHLKGVYKIINLHLNKENFIRKEDVCALVMIGKERLNIQLCEIINSQYNVYEKISFVDFSK